jgi:phage regulator Rha-like protein
MDLNKLQVITINAVLVVDSRLIAAELDIQHKNLMETIRKYLPLVEQFGRVTFETETLETNGGKQSVVFCYLNEDQATFVMTLSRNTEIVVICKLKLVKAFSEAKKQLQQRPKTNAELLLEMAQQFLEVERRQQELEAKLVLEAQRTDELEQLIHQHDGEIDRIFNPDGNYYSIRGYANLKGFNLTLHAAKELGKKAAKLSNQLGYKIDVLPDPRYGKINVYSHYVLAQVFES